MFWLINIFILVCFSTLYAIKAFCATFNWNAINHIIIIILMGKQFLLYCCLFHNYVISKKRNINVAITHSLTIKEE